MFFHAYRSFIGAGDDWDLMKAADRAQNKIQMDLKANDLERRRGWLRKEAEGYGKGPLINDQLRFVPEDPNKVSEPSFRVLSAYRIPSAILFQRTTDRRRFNRPYPDGLEVAAALGSAFARRNLTDSRKQDLLATIDSCRIYFQGKSLYMKYLNALRALLDEPEGDAPDFMNNAAWQAKSCNTVLAGWAQLRHTWALQAKQTVYYEGLTMVPEGFVEPEPEFFSRMADLADTTGNLLKQAGAFEPDYKHVVRSLEKFKVIIEKVENGKKLREYLSRLPRESTIDFVLPYMLMEMTPSEAKKGSKAYFREKAKWLGTLAEDIQKGQISKKLEFMLKAYDFDLEILWNRFEKVSRRLEAIAHKQLRGTELNRSETDFIKEYGSTIAGIMLYGGNSYLTPRDDALRIVDVYSNPERNGYLHAGVARPRKFYILYPWHGRSILCQGAIMPYYEFVAPERLIDKSWKKRLDSPKRPSIPKWMSPVVSGENLGKPELRDDR
jgi:hypothetical protein